MKLQLLLFAFLVCLASCGSRNQQHDADSQNNQVEPDLIEKYFDAQNGCFRNGIVGGSQVTPNNPKKNYVALLMATYSNGGRSVCTGVLLSRRVLLTAAHCADADSLEIYFHHSSYCSQGMNRNLIYKAERSVLHPLWVNVQGQNSKEALQQANNDLALVKLEKEAPSQYQILGIAKPQEIAAATEVVQIGYGRTGTRSSAPPVLNEVIKTAQQVKYFDHSHYLIMDQKNSHGGCSGDSGGPLLIKSKGSYRTAGVASFLVNYKSDETACESGELAYVSLGDYLPWINETLNQLK